MSILHHGGLSLIGTQPALDSPIHESYEQGEEKGGGVNLAERSSQVNS